MKSRQVKQWMAFLLAMGLVLSALAGCGKQSKESSEANASVGDSSEVSQEESSQAESSDADSAAEDVDGELVFDYTLELEYATGFHVDYYKGGYIMFTAGSEADRQFLIVPEGKSVPKDLDASASVLQRPIDRILMSSSGMASLFAAFGGLDHIKLVSTDIDGWYVEDVVKKMEAGEISFSGKYKEPDYEMITANNIQLQVDTTMVNSYPEVLEKYTELGIPYIVETSSKEDHPLGRVEWVKLWGIICDMEEEANAYFEEQKAIVESVTSAEKSDVTIAMFYTTSSSGKCYVRNGGDYMAKMIDLAGGKYNLADLNPDKTGTSTVTFEELYASIQDTDYIFFVSFSDKYTTLDEMIAGNELYASCKAVKEQHVWYTSADFTQSTAAIGSIIKDMNDIIASGGTITTEHLIKME